MNPPQLEPRNLSTSVERISHENQRRALSKPAALLLMLSTLIFQSSTVDADGVALAAIHGLNEVVKEKDGRIWALEQEVAELKALVNSLAQKVNGGAR